MTDCGYLALETIGAPIPLVAKALCRTKPRLLVHQRQQLFLAHPDIDDPTLPRPERERHLLESILHGHPALQEHLDQLTNLQAKDAKRKKKGQAEDPNSEDDDEEEGQEMHIPTELQDFFGAALDEMNDEDLPQDQRQKIKCARQKSRDKLIQLRQQMAEQKAQHKSGENTAAAASVAVDEPSVAVEAPPVPIARFDEPSVAVGNPLVAVEASEDSAAVAEPQPFDEEKFKRRSELVWVRPFVPDIPTEPRRDVCLLQVLFMFGAGFFLVTQRLFQQCLALEMSYCSN